jgi:hypothetical protein
MAGLKVTIAWGRSFTVIATDADMSNYSRPEDQWLLCRWARGASFESIDERSRT